MDLLARLFGYRTIYNGDGLPVPERGRVRLFGLIAEDDEATKSTNLTLPDFVEIADATDLAIPNTLGKRSGTGRLNRGGTSVDDIVSLNSAIWRSAVTDVRILEAAPTYLEGDWAYDYDLQPINVINNTPLLWPLRVPQGAKLTHIRVNVTHREPHGAMPTTRPRLSLRSVEYLSGDASEIISTDDPSATTSDYEQPHVIHLDLTALGGGGVVVDTSTDRYEVRLMSESGENALAGLQALAVQVTYIRPVGGAVGRD